MDRLWVILAGLALLAAVYMVWHSHGTYGRIVRRSSHVLPLTRPGTTRTSGALDEVVETYHRSHILPGVSDPPRRSGTDALINMLPRQDVSAHTNTSDSDRCYINWIHVEGDDEELPADENETCDELDGSLRCKICFTNKISTVFLPCFHAAVCISCANRLEATKVCPICRNRIDTPRRLFL